tara:strand:+ start:59 stop:352 length:294 start_codon:yes stop_codon:yes gene_type:complete
MNPNEAIKTITKMATPAHGHPDLVDIDADYINRHNVLYCTLEEWQGEDTEEAEFPFRLTIVLNGGIEKIYELATKEYATEIIQKLNGSYHAPIKQDS